MQHGRGTPGFNEGSAEGNYSRGDPVGGDLVDDSTGLSLAHARHCGHPELVLGERLQALHLELQLLRGNALLVRVLVVPSIPRPYVNVVLGDDAMWLRRRNPRDKERSGCADNYFDVDRWIRNWKLINFGAR